MKKYLMIGFAAIAFASCSNHDFETMTQEQIIKAQYEANFVAHFNTPASNQDWGLSKFKTGTRAAFTRVSTKSGDVYNKFPSSADIKAKIPTSIPGDADELPTNGDYNYYFNNGAGHNYKITSAGTYTIGGSWQNVGYDAELDTWNMPHPYNVYVSVEGDDEVVIEHNGSAMHNLYILKGNVKLGSSVGQMTNVVITVAKGATLTDTREGLAARTDLIGNVDLYNLGTFYATNTTKYDMGNKARFYNEGTCDFSSALTYSPADAENSFFMNLGDDAELTAPSMTLNSTGNFFNSGKTTINGETNVTQSNIVWVNDGTYKTSTMSFSAQNTTFYNYCNLIVTGNAHMFDGEFNLMDNSYTEIGSADMDNFIVNMGSNTGMNIKGNLDLTIGQGDGTYQGFRTTGSNDFLRVEGTVTVAEHMYTLQLTGDITYAFGALVDLGKDNSGVQPTYVFNEGTTECALADLTVTPNTASCGATWKKKVEEIEYTGRVMAEDLTVNNDPTGQKSDWDFNDVVFDWAIKDGNAYIMLRAAGGSLPLRIGGYRNDDTSEPTGSIEIHSADGLGAYMVNTGLKSVPAKAIVLYGDANHSYQSVEDILLTVQKGGSWIEITAYTGEPAAKFYCEKTTDWCDEYVDINIAYPKFKSWVGSPSVKWEDEVEPKLVDLNLKNNTKDVAE